MKWLWCFLRGYHRWKLPFDWMDVNQYGSPKHLFVEGVCRDCKTVAVKKRWKWYLEQNIGSVGE